MICFHAQALEELQREGRIVAEAAGNEALELAINGSNSVEFRGRGGQRAAETGRGEGMAGGGDWGRDDYV